MKEKIIRVRDPRTIIYSEEHNGILAGMRKTALEIMRAISSPSVLYGSAARGDVNAGSDIDIVLHDPVETYKVELPLAQKGYNVESRELVMANPNSIPKAHIHLESNATITIPLFKPSTNEEEFYRFGGSVDIRSIENGQRVPGVTKKLLLIEPVEGGHIESSIIGREVEISKKLKIGIETVNERIRVLSRRDSIGRTGVYLKEELDDDDSFESFWKRLSDRDPVLRRQKKIRKR